MQKGIMKLIKLTSGVLYKMVNNNNNKLLIVTIIIIIIIYMN